MESQLIYVFLFLSFFSNAQISNAEKLFKLEIELSRMESEFNKLNDSIKIVKREIEKLKSIEFLHKFDTKIKDISIKATILKEAKLRKSSSSISSIIKTININDTVTLTDYKQGYWIVYHENNFGYLSEIYVKENEEINSFKLILIKENEIQKEKEKEALELKLANEEKILLEQERLYLKEQMEIEKSERKKLEESVIKKYGNEIGKKLLDGYYWIGMTEAMALVSLGEPKRINKSVGSWGVHEQWIYGSIYLYFENGKLTSYQNSN